MSELYDVYSFRDLEDGSCMVYVHKQDINDLVDEDSPVSIQSVTCTMSFSNRDEADNYVIKKVIIDSVL